MNTLNKLTAANTSHDKRFANVNHTCLLPGRSNVKCDHWGCKVTAKSPQYYPGWKKFFNDRETERFYIHKSDLSKFTKKKPASIPKEAKEKKAWLTPMPAGSGNKPNLNTGWIVEAVGYWPEREIYSANEVEFIHVEYQTIRSKSQNDIQRILATKDVKIENYLTLLNDDVIDVREVVVFVGKEAVNG